MKTLQRALPKISRPGQCEEAGNSSQQGLCWQNKSRQSRQEVFATLSRGFRKEGIPCQSRFDPKSPELAKKSSSRMRFEHSPSELAKNYASVVKKGGLELAQRSTVAIKSELSHYAKSRQETILDPPGNTTAEKAKSSTVGRRPPSWQKNHLRSRRQGEVAERCKNLFSGHVSFMHSVRSAAVKNLMRARCPRARVGWASSGSKTRDPNQERSTKIVCGKRGINACICAIAKSRAGTRIGMILSGRRTHAPWLLVATTAIVAIFSCTRIHHGVACSGTRVACRGFHMLRPR